MYLHIGEDVLVKTNDIIAIIDKQMIKNSMLFQEFLEKRKEQAVNLSKGELKSIVITNSQVYFSPYSSGTLKKRSNQHIYSNGW